MLPTVKNLQILQKSKMGRNRVYRTAIGKTLNIYSDDLNIIPQGEIAYSVPRVYVMTLSIQDDA